MPDNATGQNLSNPQDLVDAALSGSTPKPITQQTPVETPQPQPIIPVEPKNNTTLPLNAKSVEMTEVTDETPLGILKPETPITPPSNPPQEINRATNPPKKKTGFVVAGIALLIVIFTGGIWMYGQFGTSKSKTPQVAVVTDQCKKECKDSGKSEVQCRNECQPETTTDTSDYTPPKDVAEGEFGYKYPGGDIAGTYRCGENNSKLCLVDSPGTLEAAAVFCKDHSNVCDNQLKFTDTVSKRIKEAQTGLTPCAPGDSCPVQCKPSQLMSWIPTNEPGGGKYCDDEGRECKRYRIERMQVAGGAHCFVGYDEQCGEPGQCGPGSNSPRPSPSPSPTMACTGLTQSPSTTPVIGTKLTFTCTGSVSPVNSGSLSYKFRYSINNGSLTTLANKTATTAELTIASCGSYLVECQACATLGGTTKCDPTWTGATQ